MSPRHFITHAGTLLGFGLGRADYHKVLESTARGLEGMSEAEMVDLGERAFKRRLSTLIYEEARLLIDAHKRKAHQVVIVTSATRYQVTPIARELGVEHVYCSELEIECGTITGKVAPCYGAGKLDAANQFIRNIGAALDDAYFYTDSTEDLPLLEAVGRPVVANPKPALSKVAAEKGWPQIRFEKPGNSGAIAA